MGEAVVRLIGGVVRQKRWRKADAAIQYLDVEMRTTRTGVRRCNISAEYSYVYRGEKFISRTVSVLDSLPGLVNGYPTTLGVRLKSNYEAKRTVEVLVDPTDPSRAVLLAIPLQGYVWLFTAIFALALTAGVLEMALGHPSIFSLSVGGTLGLGIYFMWHRVRKPSFATSE